MPADHPRRAIKRQVDVVLKKLSPLFEELGRPSIPPEQLLKARVRTALDSVRSERLFCEPLGYNLLGLGFPDREFSPGRFDPGVLAKNDPRVLSAEVAQRFFAEVSRRSRQQGWTSDEHFTGDGTLIESWASLKSCVRKDGTDAAKVQSAQDQDPGNPSLNFRGEKRCPPSEPDRSGERAVSKGQGPRSPAGLGRAHPDGKPQWPGCGLYDP